MTQLVIATPPAFSDSPEDLLVVAQPVKESAILAVLRNSKFGAVREEVIFMGFFQNGDTIPLAVSPVDGYTYSAEEITYRVMMYSTRAAAGGFTPGQTARPTMSSSSTPGNVYWWTFDVDDATHVVATSVSYYIQDGAETITNGGIVKVLAVCQRQSDNAFVGSPQGAIDGAAGTGLAGTGGGTAETTPGGGYTFVASDVGKFFLFDSGGSDSVTIPDDTDPGFSGFYCYIQVNAPGDLTINGVTQLIDGLASENFVGTNAFTLTATSGGGGYETV